MSLKPFVIVPLLAASFAATAQRAPGSDTVLKGSTIEVIQSYKPKVKQTPKPEWIPQLPPADTAHPAFTYTVPQQALNYSYSSAPLRPLALGATADPLPFPNYVKAGGGNLSTIFVDAGFGGIYGKDYETALHVHHLSQKGSIKNQQQALTGLEAEGTLHNSIGDWHGGIAAERNQYSYYGYDHNLFDYSRDAVKQTYNLVKLSADLNSRPDSNSRISYHPAVNASLYNARNSANELSIGFDAPARYTIDSSVSLLLALNGDLTSYKAAGITTANNFLQLLPGVDFHTRHFSGHALAGFALGKGNAYILPDVIGSYTLPVDKVTFSVGYKATIRQNTYEQLSTENPYMLNTYFVRQNRRDEVFAELQGSIGTHLTLSGRASWWKFTNLATYLSNSGDQKQFYIWYEDTKALSFQAGARYHVGNIWSAGVVADFYKYYDISDQFVWHEPSVRIRADVMVHPVPRLTATAYIASLGGIHARDASFTAVTLKPFTDLGLNGEYQFIPRLSAFLQVSNLLNDKYERWLGYQAYGINIYGGIRLKF